MQIMLDRRKRDIFFGLGVLLLFLSTPLYMNYLPCEGAYLVYFEETEGAGAPFLALLPFLSGLGISILNVCKIYLLMVNILTCVISWYAFSGITGNAYAGLAGCLCYSASTYSMYIRYEGGFLGEAAAFSVLPLAFYGLWSLLVRREKRGSLFLGLGLLGVFCADAPSGLLLWGLACLISVLRINSCFDRKRWLCLLAALIIPVGLTLPLWMPCVEGVSGSSVFREGMGSVMADGLDGAQLVTEVPGLALMVILAVWMTLAGMGCLDWLGEYEHRHKKLAACAAAAAICCMLLSLIWLPWDKLRGFGGIIGRAADIIGYPPFWGGMAVLCLSLLTAVLTAGIRKKGRYRMGAFFAALILLNVFSGGYYMNQLLYTTERQEAGEEAGAAEIAEAGEGAETAEAEKVREKTETAEAAGVREKAKAAEAAVEVREKAEAAGVAEVREKAETAEVAEVREKAKAAGVVEVRQAAEAAKAGAAVKAVRVVKA